MQDDSARPFRLTHSAVLVEAPTAIALAPGACSRTCVERAPQQPKAIIVPQQWLPSTVTVR